MTGARSIFMANGSAMLRLILRSVISARSVARLYDALADPSERDLITTVDRFGIRTHRFFTSSYSAQELLAARDAVARWARLTYGFMGRTPDYRASFMATLGARDAIGTEFGSRHELYERNYAGNHEQIRVDAVNFARRTGVLDQCLRLLDQWFGGLRFEWLD